MIDQIDQALADMKVIEETIEGLRKQNASLRYDNEQLRKTVSDLELAVVRNHQRHEEEMERARRKP